MHNAIEYTATQEKTVVCSMVIRPTFPSCLVCFTSVVFIEKIQVTRGIIQGIPLLIVSKSKLVIRPRVVQFIMVIELSGVQFGLKSYE